LTFSFSVHGSFFFFSFFLSFRFFSPLVCTESTQTKKGNAIFKSHYSFEEKLQFEMFV
jgi:hypothetical protein